MKYLAILLALPLALATRVSAQEEPVTPASIVEASASEEWVEIPPDDILIMRLSNNVSDVPRDVVIQLMPAPFSQPWVRNIRTLARAHWWDGTSVYRVVDNWVTQWGDVSEEKALPEGVVSPVAAYDASTGGLTGPHSATFIENIPDLRLPSDSYAAGAGFLAGWPMASDHNRRWPIHCYGHVGVARDIETTGTGSELYAVIGHAPRQLDRNIAVVGRVIAGIEHLSTMSRGTGEAGVYKDRDEDTLIAWVRLASEMEESEHWRFEYLDTASDSFAAYVESRANRHDAFYTVPVGGVDICNVQVPIRHIDPAGGG